MEMISRLEISLPQLSNRSIRMQAFTYAVDKAIKVLQYQQIYEDECVAINGAYYRQYHEILCWHHQENVPLSCE